MHVVRGSFVQKAPLWRLLGHTHVEPASYVVRGPPLSLSTQAYVQKVMYVTSKPRGLTSSERVALWGSIAPEAPLGPQLCFTPNSLG